MQQSLYSGDMLILEYFQPHNESNDLKLSINRFAYAYRDISGGQLKVTILQKIVKLMLIALRVMLGKIKKNLCVEYKLVQVGMSVYVQVH